eukprot:236203_1
MSTPFDLIASEEIQQYFQLPNKIKLSQKIFDLRQELIDIYRHIHRRPELSWNEINTTDYVEQYLNSLTTVVGKENLIIKRGVNVGKDQPIFFNVGIVATLKGGQTQGTQKYDKCIMLRADLDALPVQEKSGVTYESEIDGVSHCCGHDAHTAILLVTAKVLCSVQSYLCGYVKFVFQPAEENGPASYWMIKNDHILSNPKVDQVFALHLAAERNVGKIAINMGTMLAGSSRFRMSIKGKGGHAGMPEFTKSVIVAQSTLILTLQTIVSRNIAADKGGVISIGKVKTISGTSAVLPDSIVLEGGMRWYEDETEEILKQRLREIYKGIETMYNVEIEYEHINEFGLDYPATINRDEMSYKLIVEEGEKIVNEGLNDKCNPIAAAEDFSYFLNEVGKGAWFFLGSKDIHEQNPPNHHTERFIVDEKCLLIGCQVMTNIIGKLLYRKQRKKINSKL